MTLNTDNADQPSGNKEDQASSTDIAGNERERIRLVNLLRFFRKSVDLDTAIYSAIEPILSVPLSNEENLISSADVNDIIISLPPVKNLITPTFLKKIAFPLRMMRYCLDVHNVDPVPQNFLSLFSLTPDENYDANLHEQLWFLLFIGADPQRIHENLNLYRHQESILNRLISTFSQELQPKSRSSVHTTMDGTPKVTGQVGTSPKQLKTPVHTINIAQAQTKERARAHGSQDYRIPPIQGENTLSHSYYRLQEVPSLANQTNAQASQFARGPEESGLDVNRGLSSMQERKCCRILFQKSKLHWSPGTLHQ